MDVPGEGCPPAQPKIDVSQINDMDNRKGFPHLQSVW